MKEIVEIKIIYDLNNDTINVISGFENNDFEDPIGNTTRLIELGLEKWIIEKVGLYCPKCEIKMQPSWEFCPQCGWSWREYKDAEK